MKSRRRLRGPFVVWGSCLICGLAFLLACSGTPKGDGAFAAAQSPRPNASGPALTVAAESNRRWTGLAVTPDGRLVVNYPRWSDDVPISVSVLNDSGEPVPFPSEAYNDWQPGDDPNDKWVCVQSVVLDADGRLWVLDPGNPRFTGVVPGAPKLARFDSLNDKAPAAVYRFDAPAVLFDSYLNDVRIDLAHGAAYITDSGNGALVVLNLDTKKARRVLDDHPSTHAQDEPIEIDGRVWKRGGQIPRVHADGIAFNPSGDMVYFQALSAKTLYRIPAGALRDESLSDDDLALKVEAVALVGPSDGLLFHRGLVWLSSLEHNAIRALAPHSGDIRVVAQDPRISWPDSFAAGPEGDVFFTTSQIHLGGDPPEPFRILRIPVESQGSFRASPP